MVVDSEDEEECNNQYRIIRKLKAELEEEREAAATAASEVLSNISRLQKKLAQEKMESSQYKRMIGVLIINYDVKLAEKQAQVDSLKFQIQKHVQSLSEIIGSSSYDMASNCRTSDAEEEDDNSDVVKEKDIDQCWVSGDRNNDMSVVDDIKTESKLWPRGASTSSNSIQSGVQDIFEVPPSQQYQKTYDQNNNNTYDQNNTPRPPPPPPRIKKKSSSFGYEKLGMVRTSEIVPANAEPVWFHRDESAQPPHFLESKLFEQRLRKVEEDMMLQSEINRREEQTKLLRELNDKWSATQSLILKEEAKKLDSELSDALYSLLEVAMLSAGV